MRWMYPYLRCAAKMTTFTFWVSFYLMVMRLTLFKSNGNTPVVKEWLEPDNYTKWLLQGPVTGEDDQNEEETSEWYAYENETIAEMNERANRVRDVCRRKNLTSQHIQNKEFFVDYKHNLVWCNIFKAASSYWLYKFNILGGYNKTFLAKTRHYPLILARKKFPRPNTEELLEAVSNPGVITFLIVREPFVRLLSAYRDKLETVIPLYYKKLAREIVNKYRDSSTLDDKGKRRIGPTFPEFVSYLIDYHKSRDTNESINEHWAPYYRFCSPCAIHFNVIAKVESLFRDSKFIIQELGLVHVLSNEIKDKKTRLRIRNKSRDGKDAAGLIKQYYSQLNEQMLNDLLGIYETDFEMFGYDSSVYHSYVNKNKESIIK